uniref:(northern house mosquito) hypothetical protein n=1 Tax=Culex pipiens TaxID=7175 RepID=A0A8D8BQG1_CULPI
MGFAIIGFICSIGFLVGSDIIVIIACIWAIMAVGETVPPFFEVDASARRDLERDRDRLRLRRLLDLDRRFRRGLLEALSRLLERRRDRLRSSRRGALRPMSSSSSDKDRRR